MLKNVRIELHCHSSASDGALPPEIVAEKLALTHVQFASLTDHDTIESQIAFRSSLSKYNISFISGIELTTFLHGQLVHILGYGFDLDNSELKTVLKKLQQSREKVSFSNPIEIKLSSQDAIGIIKRAGGIAVLPHPLVTEPNIQKLEKLVEDLASFGLDGIEVIPPLQGVQKEIFQIAQKNNLIVSGGTDFHFKPEESLKLPGIDFPWKLWQEFRNRLIQVTHNNLQETNTLKPFNFHVHYFHRKYFLSHLFLPVLLTLLLFSIVLFVIIPKNYEAVLIERKREMIRELTNAAWSILQGAASDVYNGTLSIQDAQSEARLRISTMRYGREGKDYFWIQDTTPKMIMHPYRQDLIGEDLSKYIDQEGNAIFVKFSDLVKSQNEGYVNYVWQWKDDSTRLELKESYVRLFKPWGWIIGTGMYIHDVKDEINQLRRNLILLFLAIIGAVIALLTYILRQAITIEKKRTLAENQLQELFTKHQMLIEAATEGVLIFSSDLRCLYGNPIALEILNCTQREIELLFAQDIFLVLAEDENLINSIRQQRYNDIPTNLLSKINKRDGSQVESSLNIKSASGQKDSNFIVVFSLINTRDESKIVQRGILRQLLNLPETVAFDIQREINLSKSPDEIILISKRVPALVQSLLENGAFAPEIAKMLSTIADTITKRCIEIAMEIYGPAPVPFAFLALGSQGRQEQTLLTDQDNAIILSSEKTHLISEYFDKFTDFVCSNLVKCGYLECKGAVMANNHQFCQSLSVWYSYFNSWISRADTHELMKFSVFFDFRVIYGDSNLGQELRNYINESIKNKPVFFAQAAQSALLFKAPLRLFGKLIPSSVNLEKSSLIDLKSATMPIINFARLYALLYQIPVTNTIARMKELVRKGVLLSSKQFEIITAYEILLRLRLRYQIRQINSGELHDNLVDSNLLGHIEHAALRECFNEIDIIQTRIHDDFLGGE